MHLEQPKSKHTVGWKRKTYFLKIVAVISEVQGEATNSAANIQEKYGDAWLLATSSHLIMIWSAIAVFFLSLALLHTRKELDKSKVVATKSGTM